MILFFYQLTALATDKTATRASASTVKRRARGVSATTTPTNVSAVHIAELNFPNFTRQVQIEHVVFA